MQPRRKLHRLSVEPWLDRECVRAQCVQKRFVIAKTLQIFDARSTNDGVVRQAQDMIAFVIRQMPLEHVNVAIDQSRQPHGRASRCTAPIPPQLIARSRSASS